MKKIFSVLAMTITAAIVTLTGANSALALPTLQLDIAEGYYDAATETIIASDSSFVLYAVLTADATDTTAYYISAAVAPKVAEPGATLGSFVFDGTSINVTGDMVFGTPPIAVVDKELATHEIFETYFSEFEFQFDAGDTTTAYNAADNPGGIYIGGTGAYFAAFNVDVSSLSDLYTIHFDLYTYGDLPGGDRTGITEFAPFSHDAQSGPGTAVPEPATMLLFGTGLVGLAGIARRKVR